MGFEPTTFCMASRRSSQLSYSRSGVVILAPDRGTRRRARPTTTAAHSTTSPWASWTRRTWRNPVGPRVGRPDGVGSWGTAGSTVYTYGNSELRGGITALSPKQGIVVQNTADGWSHDVYTVTPGIPGDSGSGFMSATGGAIGVLSTVQIAPLAGSNGVGDPREIAYMHANEPAFSGVNLVPGTEPFNPDVVGAALKPVGL
jgi:hypothetical protein